MNYKLLYLLIFIGITYACKDKNLENVMAGSGEIPDSIDYNLHIKPILSDRCFACHGPDKNAIKAGLQLHNADLAYVELKENPGRFAIVPGKVNESEVIRRILSNDPEFVMPPPESNLKLNQFEKDLISKWIEQGAQYKPHWSMIPIEETSIPVVKDNEWPSNPIDNFIAKKQESFGLQHQEKASKEKLLRRLSFDITGLPPTIEELQHFQENNSPDAYEQEVDRLLESPHYGERMASDWLDVARYADSHGYQDDRPRTMWPWRDWVIKAFNDNLPYDDFVTWQLAGDLLPDPTFEHKLASGFNRNHAITQEGGIIEEEYLTEYAADRVQTFGTAFIGLTLQCARCHDHKYDAISQKEFYELYAFFNNIKERGKIGYSDLSPAPSIKYENEKLEAEVEEIRQLLAKTETEMAGFNPAVEDQELESWYNALQWDEVSTERLLSHYQFEEVEGLYTRNEVDSQYTGTLNYKLPVKIPKPMPVQGRSGNALQFDGTNTVTIGDVGDFEYHEAFSLGAWINYEIPQEHIAGILSRRNGEHKNSGYGIYLDQDGKLRMQVVHSRGGKMFIDVRTKAKVPRSQWTNVVGTYDGSGKASGIGLYINGEKRAIEVVRDSLAGRNILVGTQVTVGHWMIRALNNRGLGGFKGAIEDIMLHGKELSPLEVKYLYNNQPLYDRRLAYDMYLKRESKQLAYIQSKLDSLRAIDIQIPHVMIMEELDTIKPAYVLDRGVYDAIGEKVGRQTPESILPFSDSLPKNRLGLAMWLFERENPLTSRVMTNRVWQMFFGKGLVSTPEDFGNQGSLPSHPELLDWLSLQFMENGWDIKELVKLIVMSSTYQQSSGINERSYKIDPENIYLSRGPDKTLTAEMIRDQALAASGLLNNQIGGRWVKPYQPDGIWKELANQIGENKYRQSKGKDLYRRSIYTYWKRTIPVPSMLIFDASERAMCTVKRQSTSTPLQSLVLLNDPQYIEASRVLAANLLDSGEPDEWITRAFKRFTSRIPDEDEVDLLREIYDSELIRFEQGDNSEQHLLAIGETGLGSNADQEKIAALSIVINAIINLDESKHS